MGFLFLATVPGCSDREAPKKISLEKDGGLPSQDTEDRGKKLRVAVGGMIVPKEGFLYYKNFLDYLGDKLKMHVELVDREGYEEINRLIKSGDVDAAFVCSGPYVDGKKDFGMELLAAPQAYGKTVYHSYIIVPKNSPVTDFNGLRGRKFAFTDPESNTGKLVPTFILARMNETPESFFSGFVYTKTHDKAIKAVARGMVDGAAVDSLIWEYARSKDPKLTAMTRIVSKSPPYAIPPFVVRPGLDRGTREKLREIFLNAHLDEKGKEILKDMMIDKFVVIDDSAYDSIREMKAWIARGK
ncbi:MAG: phosphate/phosphite/phosphonate ABC transporter substrate-binding protein [Nitrospirae bacterium]|nr:phosphate/phosphite/phosphonate ABC transporter substrate-binding protein [Nitrospirota bacterium]